MRTVVFFQQFAHAIVRQSFDAMIVAAGHVVIVDERIDDRFLGRLHDRLKDRIEPIVGDCLNRMRELIGICGVRICS